MFLGPAHFYEDDMAIKLRLRRAGSGRTTRQMQRNAAKARICPEAQIEAEKFTSQFKACVAAACAKLDVQESELYSASRMPRVTTARFVIAWIGYRRLNKSYHWLGHRLKRDHSTIVHSVRTVDENWPRFEPFVAAVAEACGAQWSKPDAEAGRMLELI